MIYTHVLNRGGRGVRSPADRLVELYASLTDQKAVPSKGSTAMQRVPFKVEIPVTKEELLYAIERTLALSGLAIVSAGEKIIQAGPSPEVTNRRN